MKRLRGVRSIRWCALGVLAAAVLLSPAAGTAAPGDELWFDQVNADGDSGGADAVVAVKKLFAVAGGLDDVSGSQRPTLRAYNAKTGELAWDDEYLGGDGNGSFAFLGAKGKRLFGAGRVRSAPIGEGGQFDQLVRAWDAKTGTILWTDQLDGGDTSDSVVGLAVGKKAVFVAAEIRRTFPDVDVMVTAYRAKSGDLLWDETYDSGDGDSDDVPSAIAAAGKRVFVVGRTDNGVDPLTGFLRCHDQASGELLWDETFPGVRPRAVTAKGKRVFVAGRIDDPNTGADWTLSAHDTRTGDVLWDDQHDIALGQDVVEVVAVKGSRVVMGGYAEVASNEFDAYIRVHDARSGDEIGTGSFNGAADGFDEVETLAIKGRTVLTGVDAGATPGGCSQIAVVAFSLRTGGYLWESLVDHVGDDSDVARGIAVKGKRVVVAGERTAQGSGETDFYVRAISSK